MSDISSRVASKFLASRGHIAEAEAIETEVAQTAALPKSGPGMQMFKGMLDNLMAAYEEGNGDAFGDALDALQDSHVKLNR